MHVAVLYARLHIPGARSLKDKRRVVKSVLERARQRYGVAAAEVDDQEARQVAGLGFAFVSGRMGHAREVVEKVLGTLREHPEALLTEHQLDLL